MSKKFRLLMVLVLMIGLLGGLMTASTVSADPNPGTVIEIPRIDLEGDWDTTIHVQNVGGFDGGVVAFFWPAWDGTCPSNDPGPMGHACMQLPFNGVWTLHTQIPSGAYSAIIYSVDAALFQDACADAAADDTTEEWKVWVDDYAETGPPVAVTVDRWGTDSYGEFEISASYTGISDPDMVGAQSKYFAPYVMNSYNDLDTVFTIQNSGEWCTSCWIYYKEEGNCEYMKAQHIEAIAPGQAIRVGPNTDVADIAFPTPELAAPWLGSAYISCNEPMAIVIDQVSHDPSENQGTMLSMRGMPYDQEPQTEWYADLLYREISGYSSSIQVQNLTMDSMPTFVTVEFFDQSGDHILFVGEWVCRNGATTFYLPAIVDLGVNFPFGYVGAAEIQSHWQVDYPGGWHPGEPIFAIVDIKKTKVYDEGLPGWRHTQPGETQGGAYNAHPFDQKVNAWGWAMPFIAKEQEGVTSRIVIRNNSNCTKINGDIYIKDETGTIVAYIPVSWLQPKHMKVFDLAYFGQIARGFVGAAEFWVWGVEQLCDLNGDGETDIEPVMPSVVVVNYGYEKELPIGGGAGPQTTEGDLTRIYEGIPFYAQGSPCVVNVSGNVIDEVTLQPIDGANVNGYLTDSTGYFEFNVGSDTWGTDFTVDVFKAGYNAWSAEYTLFCEDLVVNPELDPECDSEYYEGFVEDKMTGEYINGAEVCAWNYRDLVCVETEPVQDPFTLEWYDGYYFIELPFDYDGETWVWAEAEGYNSSWDTVTINLCGALSVIDFQLHQTPKSRVLLYYGNGGWDDGTNYNELAALFEDLGYIVDYTGAWPNEFDWTLKYELIVLLAPGHETYDPVTETEDLIVDGFTWGQKADLDTYLQQEGKLVILSDATSFTGHDVENDLLGDLPVELLFVDSDFSSGHGDQITDDCLTTNVAVYSALDAADNWAEVADTGSADPGELILQNAGSTQGPNAPMYAADVPSHGNGWVAILGDLHGLSDAAVMPEPWNYSADNEWIPFNWIACAP